jgi:hypothetical protein
MHSLSSDHQATLAEAVTEIDEQCVLLSPNFMPNNELDWKAALEDNVALDGFGHQAQVYVKTGFTCTCLHDEIFWLCSFDPNFYSHLFRSSAVNLMSPSSLGATLWISATFDEVTRVFGRERLSSLINNQNISQVIDDLIESKATLHYAFQTPGWLEMTLSLTHLS